MRFPLALLLSLAACHRAAPPEQSPASAPARRVIRDTFGREVSLPAEVRRVVSLAPSTTEVLYAVGAGPLVVGADKYSDYPPAVAAVEKLGADIDPSLERIIALHPDVIFTATTANTQRTVEGMARLGLPIYVSRAETVTDLLLDVTRIAEAVGRPTDGQRVERELQARIAAVRARVAGLPPTRALVVVWSEPLIVAGGATHVDEMIRIAGGVNIAHDSPQPYPTYSIERLIVQAPEVIAVGTHVDQNLTVPAALAKMTTVPAVRDHRIVSIDGDIVFRPGPRVVAGIERLAALFHPDLAPATSRDGGAP